MAFNFGAYYMTNWNPTYYADVLGLGAAEVRALFEAKVAQTTEGRKPDASKARKRDSRLNQVPSG